MDVMNLEKDFNYFNNMNMIIKLTHQIGDNFEFEKSWQTILVLLAYPALTWILQAVEEGLPALPRLHLSFLYGVEMHSVELLSCICDTIHF